MFFKILSSRTWMIESISDCYSLMPLCSKRNINPASTPAFPLAEHIQLTWTQSRKTPQGFQMSILSCSSASCHSFQVDESTTQSNYQMALHSAVNQMAVWKPGYWSILAMTYNFKKPQRLCSNWVRKKQR